MGTEFASSFDAQSDGYENNNLKNNDNNFKNNDNSIKRTSIVQGNNR